MWKNSGHILLNKTLLFILTSFNWHYIIGILEKNCGTLLYSRDFRRPTTTMRRGRYEFWLCITTNIILTHVYISK